MTRFFGPSPLQESPVSKFFFSNTIMSWLWLIVRVYVGYQWIDAALHKLPSPAWMQTGDALKGYWMNAVNVPEAPAKALIHFDWYRSFLQTMIDNGSYVWFAKAIAIGELLVGIAMVIGLFVGTAAFFGALMNFNFLLAGSLGAGPLLLVLQILLVAAWKIAGHLGVNYFVHKRFGTLWQKGYGAKTKTESAAV